MTHFNEEDRIYMSRALRLAAQALGRTSPNPAVGCVLVNNHQIIGEGYHHQAGTPHAEVHALQAAGLSAQGGTAYVTLEPCSHFGRTPPCADALIQAGIHRVVIAMKDPNPLVSGRGIERLKNSGITVQVGLLEDQARCLNEGFIKAITTGLPFVTYKSAFTLDGKIAAESGDSRWVSNENSREEVQHLRNINDVIMVGSETVVQDNPSLTCRLPEGRNPVKLIVDGRLRISPEAKVFRGLTREDTCIIATTEQAAQTKAASFAGLSGVKVWPYPAERHVPLKLLMQDIVKRGWNSVLLEGGGTLAGQMLTEHLIDKVDFFLALKLIGGQGPSPLNGLHLEKMADAIRLEQVNVSLDTGDLRISGYISENGM